MTDLEYEDERGGFSVTAIRCLRQGNSETVNIGEDDFVFLQNGSMTDASSLGSMTSPPLELTKANSTGWKLWENLALGRPQFGNPAVFNSCIAQSCWESFTVTLRNREFFDEMTRFSTNDPGTGGLAGGLGQSLRVVRNRLSGRACSGPALPQDWDTNASRAYPDSRDCESIGNPTNDLRLHNGGMRVVLDQEHQFVIDE